MKPDTEASTSAELMETGQRKRELARIHVLKKELGLGEDAYRLLMHQVTGRESAGELDTLGRRALIVALTARKRPARRTPQPKADCKALMGKLEALLLDSGRDWHYGTAMAKRMFKIDRLEWCDATQLRKLVAALEYDKKRRQTAQKTNPNQTREVTHGGGGVP